MSEEKNTEDSVAEEIAGVLEEAIHNAPKKAVGFFLKAISIAIIIVAIGYAISLVFEGDREISYEGKDGSSITIIKEDPKTLIDLGK